ncbi:MAG: hypothetical protein ACI9GH_000499 [Candidatus Paceibacteria bacterium]|jgi:hypothetical protein
MDPENNPVEGEEVVVPTEGEATEAPAEAAPMGDAPAEGGEEAAPMA